MGRSAVLRSAKTKLSAESLPAQGEMSQLQLAHIREKIALGALDEPHCQCVGVVLGLGQGVTAAYSV
jgi:hypothetical protein